MSELTLFKGGMPSFLENAEMDETTKALIGSGGSGNKRISIKGNVFRMIANGEEVATNEDRAMNVVVVRSAPGVSRTYYEGQYREGENASPVCWSADGRVPAAESPSPQDRTCEKCAQNIKGSGQGDSKACRYSQKLAVVLDGDIEGDVFQLRLPATSVFGKGDGDKLPLQAYARYLASHNVPVTAVVTEMKFDLKSPVPKLTFRPVRGLTEAEWESCRSQAETDEAKDAVKHSFKVDGDKPKFAKPAISAPKPKAVEVVEEEDEEDVKPPVKASKARPKVEPEAKQDISSLLSEWADD